MQVQTKQYQEREIKTSNAQRSRKPSLLFNRLLQSFLLRNDGTAIKIAEWGHAAQERIKKIVNGMQYD